MAALRFIRRARDFGSPIERIRILIGLWQDATRPSREVKRIATEHIRDLRGRIADLTDMCDQLEALADSCSGDSRPECPILRDLSAPRTATRPATRGSARS